MRRSSFGGGGGMGGGSSNSSGGMLRALHRAVRTGGGTISGATATAAAKTSRSSRTSRHVFNNNGNSSASVSSTLSLSSSLSPSLNNVNNNFLVSLAPTWDSSDDSDWECLEGGDENNSSGATTEYYDNVLGTVPSTDEVHHAVSALQQVLEPSYIMYSTKDGLGYNSNEDSADEVTSSVNLRREVSSSESASDWIEPSIHICNSKLLQSYGASRVYDAFHLLQTEPSIQKMVISLSSDKAVWDAVLNNEAVREIRDSLKQVDAADTYVPSPEDGLLDKSDDGTIDIISWIVVNTKEKVMEIVEKIIEFVNEWFQPLEEQEKTSEGRGDATTDPFAEKLRTSFFLSVLVLLVVVVARAQNA